MCSAALCMAGYSSLHFFWKDSNCYVYCVMLEEYVFLQLDDVEVGEGFVLFQWDDTLLHFSLRVRYTMNTRLSNRCCKGRATSWPLRSSNLTPSDLIFWEHVKNPVYSEEIQDLTHLSQCILTCMTTVTSDMLARTCQEVEFHLDVYCSTNGN